jgi:hypothetical protein
VNALPRFVKTLQGKSVGGEIAVQCPIRCKAHSLPRDLRGFFILTLFAVHAAQIVIRSVCPWVALDLLLKGLRRFIQFPGYSLVVVGGDRQPFLLAGMLPQLECLGEVLTGAP